jgi:hypothetical protein
VRIVITVLLVGGWTTLAVSPWLHGLESVRVAILGVSLVMLALQFKVQEDDTHD